MSLHYDNYSNDRYNNYDGVVLNCRSHCKYPTHNVQAIHSGPLGANSKEDVYHVYTVCLSSATKYINV